MKRHYWVLTAILLGACSQNELDELTNEKSQIQENDFELFNNGIDAPLLHFKNTASFFKVYDELLSKNSEEQATWATSSNKEALLANIESCADSIMLSAPKAFQALFNKQLKVQINDSLLQYNNGKLYLTAINNQALEKPVKCGGTESSIVEAEKAPKTRQYGEVSFDRLGMNHQHEFEYSRTHKYVHEFRSFHTLVNSMKSQVLVMNYKLEFYRSGWKQARDHRDITINIQCTAGLKEQFYPIDYIKSPQGTFKNVQYIMEIPIAKITYYNGINGASPSNHVWTVTCTGKITQMIAGRPETFWEDRWY